MQGLQGIDLSQFGIDTGQKAEVAKVPAYTPPAMPEM